MANTFTQIHIHAIFSVQNRLSLIHNSWEEYLYQYITGIIQNYEHKILAINGMPDHVHVFFGMRPDQSVSVLLQKVKASSSKWINEQKYVSGKFSWQSGFGAFSYSKSQVPKVVEYLNNQKEHHQKKTFTQEYLEFLDKFEIPYDERYIFKPVE